ncbi:MAG: 30S ribosome-binding factor RbfA [Bacteroidetes bacterium]|nr:30S ribosome-binding factor RbfA [Bacteroidota bacterium]
MSIRTERVASLLKEELGAVLVRDYSDPSYGFITVTDVSVTRDLRIAKVYFSIMGNPEVQKKTMAMLERERPHLRGIVGSKLRLRYVPELQFYHDTTMDRVHRINTLINEIHKQDDAKGGGNTEGGREDAGNEGAGNGDDGNGR